MIKQELVEKVMSLDMSAGEVSWRIQLEMSSEKSSVIEEQINCVSTNQFVATDDSTTELKSRQPALLYSRQQEKANGSTKRKRPDPNACSNPGTRGLPKADRLRCRWPSFVLRRFIVP